MYAKSGNYALDELEESYEERVTKAFGCQGLWIMNKGLKDYV